VLRRPILPADRRKPRLLRRLAGPNSSFMDTHLFDQKENTL
jgi:hypothetical protein